MVNLNGFWRFKVKKDKKTKHSEPVFALDPISLKAMKAHQKAESDAGAEPTDNHLGFILESLKKDESTRQHRMAFDVEPDQNKSASGSIYRQKVGLTPDHLLKRIAGPQGDDLVNQILQARANIMASFGRPRTSRFAIGYEFQNLKEAEQGRSDQEIDLEQGKVEKMKEIMWHCGHRGLMEDWHPNLSQMLKMITRDGLTFGRFAVEFIYEKDKTNGTETLHSFRAVDAGTIYRIIPSQSRDKTRRQQALVLLQQIENKKFDVTAYDKDEYKWVQVVNGNPVQVFTEKELVVYSLYPTTNVAFNGYPLSPIDQALNAISTHINITIHNKLYFEHGRASRGMLVFKSDEIDEGTIQKIRLQFHQSINSVNNCLDGSSTIWTKEKGQVSLSDYLSESDEKTANIWTGTEWATGLVYKTDEKKLLTEIHSRNGIVLKSSPDHKFKILNEEGVPVWCERKKLKVGDYLLTNKKSPVVADLPSINGKKITPAFMEVLGWQFGDGHLGDRSLGLYYHHDKEVEIRESHLKTLHEFGIPASRSDRVRSEEEIEKVKKRYGFKNVASVVRSIKINSKEVSGLFRELGVSLSCEGKRVPSWLYTLPEEYKFPYLRGVFSADGNNAKLRSPELSISGDKSREDIKLLLLSSGIRTNLSEGKTKAVINKNERSHIKAKSILRVKDKVDFFNKIGFLQKHKQPDLSVFASNKNINDKLPRSTVVSFCKQIRDFDKINKNLTESQRQSLTDIISRDTCSRQRLLRYMNAAKFPTPSFLLDYHFEEIVSLVDTGERVDMFDVSINTEDHMFVTSGICCHNSWRMPVFGVGQEDDVSWQSIDQSGRDKEFQFLSDDTSRVIMGAFQISPEELPGYAHLARGSNTQTMSESDNEYQLTAARDVGLRPLMYDIQDFFNTHVFGKFDSQLSKTHQLVLAGLEDDSPEKEATRLQQDMGIHMSYDDVLEAVEKETLGAELGGKYPLNEQWQQAIAPFLTVGQVMEQFFEIKGAAKDPRFNYYRDPFWFQFQDQLMNKASQQMQMQMQMMQPPPPPPGEEEEGEEEETEKSEKANNYQVLNKSVANNNDMLSNMILKRHSQIVDKNMENWRIKSEQALADLVNTVKGKKEE